MSPGVGHAAARRAPAAAAPHAGFPRHAKDGTGSRSERAEDKGGPEQGR